MVSGSEMYNVVITVVPIAKARWETVKSSCRIGSLIDLLRGQLASGVMELFSHRKDGQKGTGRYAYGMMSLISAVCEKNQGSESCVCILLAICRESCYISPADLPVRLFIPRNVAQPGSAPASGAGGRRFESSHSDHYRERPLIQIRGLFSWRSGPLPVRTKISFR